MEHNRMPFDGSLNIVTVALKHELFIFANIFVNVSKAF